MSSKNDETVKKLSVISKLLYMQVRPQIEKRKKELKLSKKQLKIYEACNGTNSIEQIAEKAKCSVRYVEGLLPKWERIGLILSVGRGPSKRYLNIESLEV